MKRLSAALVFLAAIACTTANAPAPAPQDAVTPEVPITSKSPEAVEHFKKGRDFADNARFGEASASFSQAVKLDPDFAQALAYQGIITFGPRGVGYLEQANAKAKNLPKAERLFIEASLVARQGELEKAEALWKQVTEAAPNDWRAYVAQGLQLSFSQKYAEAVEAEKKAIAINPNAGPAYNMLGYSYLNLGDNAQAVEALKKYASMMPNEPNPHDSLGEAMMASGDLAGAEGEFKQALTLSPSFHIAHEGVAYTKFFRGDWAGGKEALAAARGAAMRPVERAQIDALSGFAALAEGKPADAAKIFNTLMTSPDANVVQQSFVPAFRAAMAIDAGKYADAQKDADKALAQTNDAKYPKESAPFLRRVALTASAVASGLSADAAGAENAAAALQKEAAARPGDPQTASSVHLALGMQSVAAKDLKAAAGHFEQCSRIDSYCHLAAFLASKKAGDRAGMDAARGRLTRSYLRDPTYLYARTVVDRGQPKPKLSN